MGGMPMRVGLACILLTLLVAVHAREDPFAAGNGSSTGNTGATGDSDVEAVSFPLVQYLPSRQKYCLPSAGSQAQGQPLHSFTGLLGHRDCPKQFRFTPTT